MTTRLDHATPVQSLPFQNAAAVTPSDSTALTTPAMALYVGVSGDVKVDLEGGATGIVFKAVPVGMLNVAVTKVYAIGTTATNIVALW